LPSSNARIVFGGSAARAAPAIAAAPAGSLRPMFRPRTSGVFAVRTHWSRCASQGWSISVTMAGGLGRPSGFHQVWSVESPPKRRVGGEPLAASQPDRRSKMGLMTPPVPM
jgi:hypothetical protein